MDRSSGVPRSKAKNQEIQQSQDNEDDQRLHQPGEVDYSRPIKFADECSECPDCGEPWCDDCQEHYAECACPGPHSEED